MTTELPSKAKGVIDQRRLDLMNPCACDRLSKMTGWGSASWTASLRHAAEGRGSSPHVGGLPFLKSCGFEYQRLRRTSLRCKGMDSTNLRRSALSGWRRSAASRTSAFPETGRFSLGGKRTLVMQASRSKPDSHSTFGVRRSDGCLFGGAGGLVRGRVTGLYYIFLPLRRHS